MGRQPSKKGQNQPEILRAVRVGDNADVYGPGEEQELVEALEDHVAEHNATASERGVPKLSVKKELQRLHEAGFLVNFAGVSAVDIEDIDHEVGDQDLHANSRARALVEERAPGEEGDGMVTTRRRRRARTQATSEGVESGDVTRDDDGTGEA